MDNFKKTILGVLNNRLLFIFVAVCVLFYVLVARLFDLQIVQGHSIERQLTLTYREPLDIPAPRGTIYDRFGRPLAVNKSAYTIKINPGAQVDDLNEVLLNLTWFLEEQGERFVADFPISKGRPYRFQFDDNESRVREERWKYDMNIVRKDNQKKGDLDVSAEETMELLRHKFKIEEGVSDHDAWNVLALRSMIHINRYKLYVPITIAYDVKEDTVVKLEEHSDIFKSVYADVEPLRVYPGAGYVSHIVGYVRPVTQEEFEANKDKGYKMTDNIGKTGLERAFEAELKGRAGNQIVEIGQNGRPVRTIQTTPAVQGDKLFTTLDLTFQKKVYDILENQLKEVLKNKLLARSSKEQPITEADFLSSMVSSNNVSVKRIMESGQGSSSYIVKLYVLGVVERAEREAEAEAEREAAAARKAEEKGDAYEPPPPPHVPSADDINDVRGIVADGIKSRAITPTQMLLVLHEQGIITGDEAFVSQLKSGRAGSLQVILNKLDEGEITPQMTNLDPCTGSVAVVSVEDGSVIAAVNYPSYDNNEFVNNFNNDYYRNLSDDPTRPMNNRVFMEPRAPGSTFKMVSAAAGLESGVIDRYTKIYDEVSFEKVGSPFSRCWSSVSHGDITVVEALSESCNYFFSEMAYRMGNAKSNNSLDSINVLNKYMIEFGLNERSGVEVGEYRDALTDENGEPLPLVVSSPQFKEHLVKSRNPDATYYDYGWFDGDTVRTSYGQANSNYTAAVMAKYIASIASGGVRRNLHLLNRLETQSSQLVRAYEPEEAVLIDVAPGNLNIIVEGMRRVIQHGTAKTAFSGFPIEVAGKTGTAQENLRRNDHTSFGGFAPADNPRIAVYVVIPYGDTKTTIAPSSQVARDVIGEYFGLNAQPEPPKAVHALSM